MKATILLAASLVLTGVAVLPSADADTCIFFDEDLEPVVCAAPNAAYCVLYAASDVKNAAKNLALCDPGPILP